MGSRRRHCLNRCSHIAKFEEEDAEEKEKDFIPSQHPPPPPQNPAPNPPRTAPPQPHRSPDDRTKAPAAASGEPRSFHLARPPSSARDPNPESLPQAC